MPYIHSLGIIHRDVRAESILLFSEGDTKLSNFCLATQLTKKIPVCKTRVGYLSWLALKVLSGRGYTTACDIWAVASNVIEHADGKPFLYVLPESKVRQHISYSTPDPRYRHTDCLLLICSEIPSCCLCAQCAGAT